MAADDLKSAALSSSQDFYALLSISPAASESELRRAYRKTALKYHPDKVGPSNTAALEKFHLLQLAYDVLSDPAIKELYDNARRAKEAKVERDRQFEGRRRAMKEDLERRESGVKRKREEDDKAEVEFERELRRLAEDGKRRRKEREEVLRREMEVDEQVEKDGGVSAEEGVRENGKANGEVPHEDRTVTLRFPLDEGTSGIHEAEVTSRFERFGAIEHAVLREKKLKINGGKHRRSYKTAVIVFKSVVGAHAAVTDFPKISKSDPASYGIFEAVNWATGREPDYIPKPPVLSRRNSQEPAAPLTPLPKAKGPRVSKFVEELNTPVQQNRGGGLKKVPSFGSFKGTPAKGQNSPSLDEITMIRLKNAERRRMEEKIRREEEAAAAGEAEADA
ncbi:hypothetical protein LTR37_020558 [Vermiconidia calcicola]|uniref:Uncharacterized protein n=1 Tax=Vermiconidia calcicola TaxID=1690605 RepID=A0ACC3MAZ6_9PEZI|nr:hypothetical protein LTR37_020558 [Vermiconidia calcicola]